MHHDSATASTHASQYNHDNAKPQSTSNAPHTGYNHDTRRKTTAGTHTTQNITIAINGTLNHRRI